MEVAGELRSGAQDYLLMPLKHDAYLRRLVRAMQLFSGACGEEGQREPAAA